MTARNSDRRTVEPLGEAGGGPPASNSEQADGTVVRLGGPSALGRPVAIPGHTSSGRSDSITDEHKRFLGIAYGTARAQLRKALLLRLAQKLGEDKCYRCERPILTPHEMSIDHKETWFRIDPALFWDLDNVAFSHLRCNTADRHPCTPRPGWIPPNRRLCPEGTGWCRRCEEFLPIERFHRDGHSWSGRRNTCKPCETIVKRESRRRRAARIGWPNVS